MFKKILSLSIALIFVTCSVFPVLAVENSTLQNKGTVCTYNVTDIIETKSSDGEIIYKINSEDSEKNIANDELLDKYINKLAGISEEISTAVSINELPYVNDIQSARDSLSDTEKVVFDELKSAATKIANGEIKSTTITVSKSISSSTSKRKIIIALLTDCPYELYWFDKTQGWSYPDNRTYKLTVCVEYSKNHKEDEFETCIPNIPKSVEIAKNVVEAHKNKSRYNILKAYVDYLCKSLSYNYDAVENDVDYGNPWQLIWAFDEDYSTNIVCEGYSKAFKFLCDITTSKGYWTGVECFLVTGDLIGLGGHMWNSLKIDDTNYLVDVTNTDGTDTWNYSLFLCDVSYVDLIWGVFYALDGTIGYSYDSDTTKVLPKNDLKLSKSAYVMPTPKGSGTESDPYIISSEDDLCYVCNNPSAYYKMSNDIEITSGDFTPIGLTSNNAFTGTFDGNGFVIKNLKIDTTAKYAGLFGINKGTIKNLGIMNGSVYTISTDPYVGGIVGYNYNGTVTGCYYDGTVSATAKEGTSPNTYVGGLIGRNYNGTVENCFNVGSVCSKSDTTSYFGGLIGYNSGGIIKNCYNTGTLNTTEKSYYYVGGITGYNNGTASNCYYLNDITKGNGSGTDIGTSLSDAQMKVSDSFSGFDFSTIWLLGNGIDYYYPVLNSNIYNRIISMSICALPTRLSYLLNEESIDLTGGKIAIKNLTGTEKNIEITPNMISGFDSSKIGTNTISVTYYGFNTSFDISIIDSNPISITVSEVPTSIDYNIVSKEITIQGGKIKLNYDNDIHKEIDMTSSMITDYNPELDDIQTIKIKYNELETSFDGLIKNHTVIGDVNRDTKVDAIDVIRLAKYHANSNVYIDEEASDTNGDGKLNILDLIRLCKYQAGSNVTLGK